MTRLLTRKITIFGAIALLFVLGQLLGGYAIKTLFIRYSIADLKPQIAEIASQLSHDHTYTAQHQLFIVKAFDLSGKEIPVTRTDEDDYHLDMPLNEGLNAPLLHYLPQVAAGKNIEDVEYIGKLQVKSIVLGIPIIKNGKTTGAVFLLKPASEYQTVLNGFMLVFSVTLLVGTGFIGIFLMLYLRETRHLEQLRRNYIANISHELKSPISSIQALTETLSDGMVPDTETQQRYFGIILRESRRLKKLTSEMLELSSLQSSSTMLEKQVLDARPLLQPVIEKYTALADDIGVTFRVTNAVRDLPALYTNAERVPQVLNILLDNACKFVGENGEIILDAEISRTSVTLSVTDNGIGIASDDLPYVFDRFYKQDSARSSEGHGLGLAIAKEILERMHETISVVSAPHTGSTFSFTIHRA